MGTSLWTQVWLPLLIGLAIQIVVTALGFLSVRLWNCVTKQLTPQTPVGERDHDQPRPVGDADDAKALPDLEMGTENGEESKALPDLDVGMGNGGEGEVPRRAAASVGKWAAERIRDSKKATESVSAPWTMRACGWVPSTQQACTFNTMRVKLGSFDTAEEAARGGGKEVRVSARPRRQGRRQQ